MYIQESLSVFREYLRSLSESLGSLSEVSQDSLGNHLGVSQQSLRSLLGVFQECLGSLSGLFRESLGRLSEVLGVFQECLRILSRVSCQFLRSFFAVYWQHHRILKEASQESQGSLRGVSR